MFLSCGAWMFEQMANSIILYLQFDKVRMKSINYFAIKIYDAKQVDAA